MNKKISPQAMTILTATFFMMCLLHLWFTIFVLFIGAIVITLLYGRAEYCSTYCPMGTLQNFYYEKQATKKDFAIKWFPPVFITFFWTATITSVFYFQNKPLGLWFSMLQLMMGSLIFAIIMQNKYGKRFFCRRLCPLRVPILAPVIKMRRIIKK